jgi:hypothetical protein
LLGGAGRLSSPISLAAHSLSHLVTSVARIPSTKPSQKAVGSLSNHAGLEPRLDVDSEFLWDLCRRCDLGSSFVLITSKLVGQHLAGDAPEFAGS